MRYENILNQIQINLNKHIIILTSNNKFKVLIFKYQSLSRSVNALVGPAIDGF